MNKFNEIRPGAATSRVHPSEGNYSVVTISQELAMGKAALSTSEKCNYPFSKAEVNFYVYKKNF